MAHSSLLHSQSCSSGLHGLKVSRDSSQTQSKHTSCASNLPISTRICPSQHSSCPSSSGSSWVSKGIWGSRTELLRVQLSVRSSGACSQLQLTLNCLASSILRCQSLQLSQAFVNVGNSQHKQTKHSTPASTSPGAAFSSSPPLPPSYAIITMPSSKMYPFCRGVPVTIASVLGSPTCAVSASSSMIISHPSPPSSSRMMEALL